MLYGLQIDIVTDHPNKKMIKKNIHFINIITGQS